MTDTSTEATAEAPKEEEEESRLIELLSAIMLGIAGILTGYAAYQGALAGGDALSAYTESARMNSDANSAYTEYSQTYNNDLTLYTQWEILMQRGEVDAAEAVAVNIMSLDLETAVRNWEAMGDVEGRPLNPLQMPEYTEVSAECAADPECQSTAALYEHYTVAFEDATAKFAEAQKIDDQGDNFDLAGAYLAVSLFFAGIASLLKVRRNQIGLLALSVLLFVPGIQAIGAGKGWW